MGGQRFIVASIALAGLACRERGAAIPDAATDGRRSEGSSALTLVIAVTGCAAYEAAGNCGPNGGTAPCCRGAPPLALSFAPVGSPELTRFKWSFGDDTPTTTERAPSHVYAYPGKYQVTLIGDGNDIGMPEPDPLYVVVESLPAGAPCDIKDQCGDGLTCLCAPGSGCSPAFTRGFCSMACDTADVRCGRRLRGARPRRTRRRRRAGGPVSCRVPDQRAVRSGLRLSDPARPFDDGRHPLDARLPAAGGRCAIWAAPAATPTTCSRTTPARPACARTSARSASAARAATTATPARMRRRARGSPTDASSAWRRARWTSIATGIRSSPARRADMTRQGRPLPCAHRSAAPVTPPAHRRAAADPTASASASSGERLFVVVDV